MKLSKRIYQIIEVKEGKRYLKMGVIGKELDHEWFDTNLPYKKSFDDWIFYGGAISRILKEIDK